MKKIFFGLFCFGGVLVAVMKAGNEKELFNQGDAIQESVDIVNQYQDEVVSGAIKKDKKKWAYVKEEFSKCLEISSSSIHQFGVIQQKYAIVPTVGAGIVAALICVIIAMGGRRIDRFIKIGSALVIPPLCTLSVYGFNKLVGNLLEGKADRCQKALGLFVKKWQKHKEQTPEALHSLFEALKADYKNETFHTLHEQEAQALIECLLTVGILADSKLSF